MRSSFIIYKAAPSAFSPSPALRKRTSSGVSSDGEDGDEDYWSPDASDEDEEEDAKMYHERPRVSDMLYCRKRQLCLFSRRLGCGKTLSVSVQS